MKSLKILGLAVVAVTALVAFGGASSASATVLCHTTSTPCAQTWSSGTEIEYRIASGSSAVWKTGTTILNTCTNGTLKGTMANTGNGSETVKLSVAASGFSWSSCTRAQATLEGGELEIHAISGSDNGTVTMKGFRFTTNTIFGDCVYSAGTGVHLGTLTASGSGASRIDFAVTLPRIEGLCPPTMEWIEEWEQVNPSGTALFVEPS